MALLGDKQLSLLASRTQKSPAQLNRLLDSLRVALEGEKLCDIGLRLMRIEPRLPLAESALIDPLVDAVQGYHAACPAVVQWILNGAFRPSRIPEHLDRAALLHASRTAGRLRANFLRATNLVGELQ